MFVFQSAMRIFGGFNRVPQLRHDGSWESVSIRHADFRWFQHRQWRRGKFGTPARFQSAMRIFGGFNSSCASAARSKPLFQSAMRIFGGFNVQPFG